MLYDTLLQRLREFFVDVDAANVAFHLGDLFDPSQFRLRDVFLKTEVVNALHLPFELRAAYVGDVTVEGFVGFVAGSPLSIGVADVCLVLAHKPVDWTNELALRYAKELLLALLQSVAPAPATATARQSTTKTRGDAAQWVLSKLYATIAETSVTLERLHVRFESESEGQLIAYGLHIPTVQLSTRDVDDPILRRREQPGVKYPVASADKTASKRLYLGNSSLYCDLHATSFLGPSARPTPTPTPAVGAAATGTPRGSCAGLSKPLSSPCSFPVPPEALAFLRAQCQQGFAHNADRDLVSISALWVQLDFVRGAGAAASSSPSSSSSWALAAVDVVTEEIKLNVDFTQLARLTDELARVADFVQRSQRRAWRPSCIDRERTAPAQVEVSTTSVLPVVTPDVLQSLAAGWHPRRLSRAWLCGMWRFAARCVLIACRHGDHRRVRLGAPDDTEPSLRGGDADALDATRQRYVALYKRSLSEDALRIAVFGRALLPSSPRATDARRRQHAAAALPVYEPLALDERWELSDLVEQLSVAHQRVLRHQATQLVRQDYASYQVRAAPSASTATTAGSPRSLLIEIPLDADSPLATRRGSGASISPKHGSPSSLAGVQLPPDFVANHHHHHSFTRSRAESSPAGSPTKLHGLSPPSPTTLPPPHLAHSASAPLSHHHGSPTATSAASSAFSVRAPPSPTHFARHRSLVESLLPPWMLDPRRLLPLVNWLLGPISLRLHHRTPASGFSAASSSSSSPSTAAAAASSPIQPRSRDTYMEVFLDGCTGCALLCKVPSVSFLVELRLGLVRAALVDAAAASSSLGNAIATDYIREPSDGFLYLGLKYNFRPQAARVSTSLLLADEEIWDIKAKLCVGTIHIEYDDLALQTTAMRRDDEAVAAAAATPLGGPSIRLASASYVSVVQDVLRNWKTFVQRVRPPRNEPSLDAQPQPPSLAAHEADQQRQLRRAAKQARLTKLLNALMLQSSCVELDASGIELHLSMPTSRVVERVLKPKQAKGRKQTAQPPPPPSRSGPPAAAASPLLPLVDSQQVLVTLPAASAGLQNRPLLNECQVHAGGARVKFRTTKHGRAAVVDHVLHRFFPPPAEP